MELFVPVPLIPFDKTSEALNQPAIELFDLLVIMLLVGGTEVVPPPQQGSCIVKKCRRNLQTVIVEDEARGSVDAESIV